MKVYLKFNKTDTVGYMCLLSWLDIFRDHEIILVCDLFNVNTDPVPKFLKDTIDQHPQPIKLLNTDYSLSVPFNGNISTNLYGFYRGSYVYEGKTYYLASTDFEPTDARRAFPCFDEPAMKSKFKLCANIHY